ncbi:MAG: DUF1566 domain-containing protein [Deltaproteobacteria bacterium]|nr:DUF1566 domain-containing protein [Deltaproteobacteria bacterium]
MRAEFGTRGIMAILVFVAFVACSQITNDPDDGSVATDQWTDPASGLTWQLESLQQEASWEDATTFCEGATLAGYDDWHLPTISELRTLIRGCDATETGGSCGVTDTCLTACSEGKSRSVNTTQDPCEDSCSDASCFSCEAGDGPNNGCYGPPELVGSCGSFWSSSAIEDAESAAWFIDFSRGGVRDCRAVNYCVGDYAVRCVR